MKKYFYYVLLTAISYSLLFNTPHFMVILSGESAWLMVFAIFLSILQGFILWYIVGLNRWVALTVTPVMFGLSSFMAYYSHRYAIPINLTAFEIVLGTNMFEAKDYVELKALLIVLSATIFGLFLGFIRFKQNPEWKIKSMAITLVCALIVAIATSQTYYKPLHRKIAMPYVWMEHGYKYALYQYRMNLRLKKASFRTDINEIGEFKRSPNEPLTIVFIIGESVQANHVQANGYPRPTTPYLMESGAFSFPYALSCELVTRKSIPCMLTRARTGNWEYSFQETSVVSIFNKLGFETYWISNDVTNTYGEIELIAVEAANHFFYGDVFKDRYRYDHGMLPRIFDAIDDGSSDKKLIITYTYGSHWKYADRYPPEFEIFTPACDKKEDDRECRGGRRINSYDNSIVYTDAFYGAIWKKLKDQNAIIFWVADHGSSGLDTDNQNKNIKSLREINDMSLLSARNVVYSVWFSDSLKNLYPDFANALANNVNKTVSHDYIFSSLLDCAGVSSPLIILNESICRSDLENYADKYIRSFLY